MRQEAAQSAETLRRSGGRVEHMERRISPLHPEN